MCPEIYPWTGVTERYQDMLRHWAEVYLPAFGVTQSGQVGGEGGWGCEVKLRGRSCIV